MHNVVCARSAGPAHAADAGPSRSAIGRDSRPAGAPAVLRPLQFARRAAGTRVYRSLTCPADHHTTLCRAFLVPFQLARQDVENPQSSPPERTSVPGVWVPVPMCRAFDPDTLGSRLRRTLNENRNQQGRIAGQFALAGGDAVELKDVRENIRIFLWLQASRHVLGHERRDFLQ